MTKIYGLPIETPRMVRSDAYTICGAEFESAEAISNSSYYMTFRRHPADVSKEIALITPEGDRRMLFSGLQRILGRLFHKPFTHSEIEEAAEFFKSRKVSLLGLSDFEFPKDLFHRTVDEFNGRPPIKIEGMPEGSTVYPSMPNMRVNSQVDGFGPLASWFESHLLHCWAPSERLTVARLWIQYIYRMIKRIDPGMPHDQAMFIASLQCHDFGGRAAMCQQENEDIASQHLYCFPGTDTFEAAYVAWKNGAPEGVGTSIWALAHRIVQGFVEEGDSYRTIFDNAPDNSLISMVGDLYDYPNALNEHLVPLAQESSAQGCGKIVVARPDSGNSQEMVNMTVDAAINNGLYTEDEDGWRSATTLRFIQGDSMRFSSMIKIMEGLIEKKCKPWDWGIFGVGGFLRNELNRDHFSAKYALASVGNRPVLKISHDEGKGTWPNCTVVDQGNSYDLIPYDPDVTDARVVYFDGTQSQYWGPGMMDSFPVIQGRVIEDFNGYSPDGLRFHEDLRAIRQELVERYTCSPASTT